MNIYEELYKYLQRQISLSNKKLEEYNDLISLTESLEIIFDQLNLDDANLLDIEEVLKNLNINIEGKNELFELIKYIKNIELILTDLVYNVENIEVSVLEEILDFFEISSKQKYISNLETIKNTNKYINDIDFTNQNLKGIILNFKKDIQTILLNCFNKGKEQLKEQIKKLIDHLYNLVENSSFVKEHDDLIKYIKKFDFSGPIEAFDNLEQMKEFFGIIENSTLDQNVVFELIFEICKYNVDFHNKRLSFKDTVLITNIEQNAKEIVDQLESLAKDKNSNSKDSISNIVEPETYELELTEEEQKIYSAIKEIVKFHSDEMIEHDFVECYNDDFSLENRKECYGDEGDLNWDIIITDITQILEPNLMNNKETVFEIFKYILNISNNESEIKKQNQQLTEILIKLDKEIDEILKQNISMLKKYNNLDVSKKNIYNSFYKMSLDGNLEYAKSCAENMNESIEYINLLGVVIKLSNLSLQIKEYLNNNLISKDIVDEFQEETQKVLTEYKKAKENYDNSIQDKVTDEPKYSVKNLIYFIPDDLKEYSDEYIEELEKSVTKLLAVSWKEALINSTNYFLEQVPYVGGNGKLAKYDKDIFDVYRTKGKGLTRTGFVTINICEENYQKIKKRYNIDISHTFLAIVGVISAPKSNLDNYELINNYVKRNREEIMYLVNLFGDKNSNEEELFDIVEKSLRFSKQIITGDMKGSRKKW